MLPRFAQLLELPHVYQTGPFPQNQEENASILKRDYTVSIPFFFQKKIGRKANNCHKRFNVFRGAPKGKGVGKQVFGVAGGVGEFFHLNEQLTPLLQGIRSSHRSKLSPKANPEA